MVSINLKCLFSGKEMSRKRRAEDREVWIGRTSHKLQQGGFRNNIFFLTFAGLKSVSVPSTLFMLP